MGQLLLLLGIQSQGNVVRQLMQLPPGGVNQGNVLRQLMQLPQCIAGSVLGHGEALVPGTLGPRAAPGIGSTQRRRAAR